MSMSERKMNAPNSHSTKQHTAASLADVLEKDYSLKGGAQLYLSGHEWRLVISALRSHIVAPGSGGLRSSSPDSQESPAAGHCPAAAPSAIEPLDVQLARAYAAKWCMARNGHNGRKWLDIHDELEIEAAMASTDEGTNG